MKKKNKTQELILLKYGGVVAFISWLVIVYPWFSKGWPIKYSLSYFFQYDIAIIFFVSSVLFFIGIYLKTKDKIYAISYLLILIGILYYPLPADYIRELTVAAVSVGCRSAKSIINSSDEKLFMIKLLYVPLETCGSIDN